MDRKDSKNLDLLLTIVFILFTVLFIIFLITNQNFYNWVFSRHQNQLSWYIRPIFLIPFCYFSYKKNMVGIWATVFLLLTSMFWFREPSIVNKQVIEFLRIEKEYLSGDWNIYKILISLLVPVTLFALSAAFWKRNLWFGISVLVIIAVLKMFWSVFFGGTAGRTVLLPAIIGLTFCIVIIFLGFKKANKKVKY